MGANDFFGCTFSSSRSINCLEKYLTFYQREIFPYNPTTKHPTGPGARFQILGQLFKLQINIYASRSFQNLLYLKHDLFINNYRFLESAELIRTDRLEVNGRIQTGVLSPNTRYGAYLIVKVSKHAYGLDLVPAETCIKSSNGRTVKNVAYLCCLDEKKQQMKRLLYGNREERMGMLVEMVGERREPKGRDDGWMEIELGEFETREGEDDEVNMSLTEVKGYQLKGGIVIDGIEVRPKSLN